MGDYQHAIDAFTFGLLKQPTYGWAFYRRGLAYVALGDEAHAKEDMGKAFGLVDSDSYTPEFLTKVKQFGFPR